MTAIDNSLVGKYFMHFKGNRYRVLAIAKDSETLEPAVVYQALYGDGGRVGASVLFQDV